MKIWNLMKIWNFDEIKIFKNSLSVFSGRCLYGIRKIVRKWRITEPIARATNISRKLNWSAKSLKIKNMPLEASNVPATKTIKTVFIEGKIGVTDMLLTIYVKQGRETKISFLHSSAFHLLYKIIEAVRWWILCFFCSTKKVGFSLTC